MDGSYHIDTALRGYVDRVIRKYEDRDEVNGDISEIYAEIKEAGFVVGVVRGLVKEARMDAEARHALYQQEEEYRGKLGLFAETPLGEATIRREEAEKPKPFAEQPVHPKRRGRPRKDRTAEALDRARSFLADDILDETHGSA